MKKVWKNGIVAMLFLGLVIAVAACTPPSEDSSSNDTPSSATWQWTVDIDNATVDFQNMEGTGAAAVIDGHPLEIKNGTNCTWQVAGPNILECDIELLPHHLQL